MIISNLGLIQVVENGMDVKSSQVQLLDLVYHQDGTPKSRIYLGR